MTNRYKLAAALALALLTADCGRGGPSPAPSAQATLTADQLRELSSKGDPSAEAQLNALAEAGDIAAPYSLATMYDTRNGFAEAATLAAKWYQKAAAQGDPAAQFNLGLMYYNGQGVDRDPALAAKWLRRSAEQDFAKAQSLLGEMYAWGEGVPQHAIVAMMWLNLAEARHESKDIQPVKSPHTLELEKRLTPAQVAQARKLALDWRLLRDRSLEIRRAEFAKGGPYDPPHR